MAEVRNKKTALYSRGANSAQASVSSSSPKTARISAIADKFGLDKAYIESLSVAETARQSRMQIGRVVSVTGLRVLVLIDLGNSKNRELMPRIGSIVCLETGSTDIIGMVAGLSAPTHGIESENGEVMIAELELVGEFYHNDKNQTCFKRGINTYPALGDAATLPTSKNLKTLYGVDRHTFVTVGEVSGTAGVPAMLDPVKLLQGHFGILGAVGVGKSCTATLLTRLLLINKGAAKTIIFDAHHEYSHSFGRMAKTINIKDGAISHWMLTFQELCYLFDRHNRDLLSGVEKDILNEAIRAAKKRYMQATPDFSKKLVAGDSIRITADMPIPYRMSDVIAYIDRCTNTDKRHSASIFIRLRVRIDKIIRDSQYRPLFGAIAVSDTLADFIGAVFSIPDDGKLVAIIQLGGLEPEICDVVVSVIVRYAQMLADKGGMIAPLLLLLEEAHNFLPADPSVPTMASRSLTQILNRGAKLNISIGLISSHIQALDPQALGQCDTLFAMRLPSRTDQETLLAVTPESSTSVLTKVAALNVAEGIVIGRGVPLPTRVNFQALPREVIPLDPVERAKVQRGIDLPERTLGAGFVNGVIDAWRFTD